MAVITTGSAPKALWPGIYAFWGTSYNKHPHLYPELFEIKQSEKAYEETPELISFGLAPVKEQTTSVQYDTWRQGPVTRYTHKAYALGFIVSHEELKDNLYEQVIMERTAELAFSMRTTSETVGANVYNRAFNPNFVGGDGVELLSLVHPTDNGTQSNELAVAADLSETSLEDLDIQISNAVNSRGLKVNLRARKLIVPPALKFTAERILASVLQNDTANNAVNALRSMGIISGGWTDNTYLTDTDAWFVRTDVENGMCWFDREAIEFSEDNDFDTKNMKYKAYQRYEPGWSNWRGLYGSPGA
jgi:hypothetical protein